MNQTFHIQCKKQTASYNSEVILFTFGKSNQRISLSYEELTVELNTKNVYLTRPPFSERRFLWIFSCAH